MSIVFVNYQSSKLLDCALASLNESGPESDHEAIVVDNASPDRGGLPAICATRGARLLLLGRNSGYGRAANRGFRRARGKYVAVANPDLEFRPGSVDRLVQCLEENPRAGAAGPQLEYPDGRPQPSARRYPRLKYVLAGRRSPFVRLFPRYRAAREFLYEGLDRRQEPVAVEALIGTFIVFRRDALEAVGGFDERFFLFAEDMDICRRLARLGWLNLLEPRSRVRHFYGGTRKLLRRFSEYHRLRALVRFLADGRGAPGAALVRFAGACYYFGLEACGLVGLWEREYSWRLGVGP